MQPPTWFYKYYIPYPSCRTPCISLAFIFKHLCLVIAFFHLQSVNSIKGQLGRTETLETQGLRANQVYYCEMNGKGEALLLEARMLLKGVLRYIFSHVTGQGYGYEIETWR